MRLIALPSPASLSFFALPPASSVDNCLCARRRRRTPMSPSVVVSLSFPPDSLPLCPGRRPGYRVLRPLLLPSVELLHPCPPRPAPPAALRLPSAWGVMGGSLPITPFVPLQHLLGNPSALCILPAPARPLSGQPTQPARLSRALVVCPTSL